MGRKGPLRACITTLIAATVAAVVLASHSPDDGSAAGPPADDIAVIAIDANPGGNSARSVGAIEQCVSASVGQPVDIDVVVPDPGIPAQRGMAAYQFSLLYDPTVVWIQADNGGMLLAQAAGSNVIPITDPKPDRNGVYQSWGIDFGPAGIEPLGSSETGPGVIARITLLPRSEGVSALTLSYVLVIDDASERITLGSVQSGTIRVGEPCPEQGGQTAVSPVQSSPTPAPPTPTPTPSALAASPDAAGTVPPTGAAPPPAGDASAWFIMLGLIGTLAGAGLLAIAGQANSFERRGQ